MPVKRFARGRMRSAIRPVPQPRSRNVQGLPFTECVSDGARQKIRRPVVELPAHILFVVFGETRVQLPDAAVRRPRRWGFIPKRREDMGDLGIVGTERQETLVRISRVFATAPTGCSYPEIPPGEMRYLNEVRRDSILGPVAVYLDEGCWGGGGSTGAWVITWAAAPLLGFRVPPAPLRTCPDEYQALPEQVRVALSGRWPILPESCEVFTVRSATDLFPGEHTVYQVALVPWPDELYLPQGFEDPAFYPALVIDGTVIPWNDVATDLPFLPLGLDSRDLNPFLVNVFREAESYTLTVRTYIDGDGQADRLDVLRGTVDPFRLRSVLAKEWSLNGRPDQGLQFRPYDLRPDGTVARDGGEVCAYNEDQQSYECRPPVALN